MKDDTEDICEWNLPKPKDEEIDDGRSPRVTGAIERLSQHHAISIEKKTVGNCPQTINSILRHVRQICIKPDDLRRKEYEEQPDDAEEIML